MNVALLAGLATLALALGPWADARADRSLTWHMAQHLSLTLVAAPLLVASALLRRLLAALPARAARWLSRLAHAWSGSGAEVAFGGWLAWAIVLYGAHFSPLYEAALSDARVHALEHALFLGAAFWFWTPVLAVAPAPRALPYPARVLYVFTAMPLSAFLGLALYTSSHPLYAHYAGFAGALEDQRLAGELMWLCGGAALFVALLAVVAAWGRRERRVAQRILR